ncbi:MAG: hypothetical protein A2736_01960 [Candidatus Yanofskybacteria bacterium RIFCSPHIGHO2_01_FULL_41_27]|uniref:Uncharacterized protein n=4 Tax=Parcubacteria group TaxID=1794811 RepID=A0A1F8HXU3_9BACT|nr:MAG: hypothetical protein A2736_01960 [Candidatus Yanofskybacteria bacterium RIFCSPHIGHO2_01_FULL_41_27]OGN20610.1 MAG: hypothetical protein A3B00_02155 [Candidatus Yanofskybacteria bacterium RIFCSPLOWO2_01_FULL_41_33]OGN41736.1 MAG: hypothetical protein A2606_00490 [Candidatus Yanofskybacteria bacterium RIFOXYD1_FULL_42_10]
MNRYKEQAETLRKAGYSYGMIVEKLGIPKSTLSNWLSRIKFKPNKEVLERIGKGKLKSALYKQKLKFEDIEKMKVKAAIDVGKLSKRDLFMLGIGLYLGEGTKAQEEIRIVNANPTIIKLAIKWFKNFIGVKSCHLKLAIHGYPDHITNELVAFWSKTLKILPKQFVKTSIDMRENKSTYKKRKLPYGTAHLYIKGGGTLHPGVKSLHRKIMGWIEATIKQI